MKLVRPVALILISVGFSLLALFAWRAVSVWNSSPAAKSTQVELSQEKALVGETISLKTQFRLPFHQKPEPSRQPSLPKPLVLQPFTLRIQKGNLAPDGFRTWAMEFDATIFSVEELTGQAIVLSLESWGKTERKYVNIPLPPLAVSYANNLPEDIILETELSNVSPAQDTSAPVTATPDPANRQPLFVVIALLAVALLLYFIFKKLGQPTPAWKIAEDELSTLSSSKATLPELYTALADILKRYTGARFDCPAPATCPQELREIFDEIQHAGLTPELRDQLHHIVVQNDSVRFAGKTALRQEFEEDLATVRSFVKGTSPSSHPNHA